MTDTSWATKALWVVALALLSLAFVIACTEGLKWMLGGPSMFSQTPRDALPCAAVARANPDFEGRRINPFEAAALLRACNEQKQQDLVP